MSAKYHKPATLDELIETRNRLQARIDRLMREKDDIDLELDEAAGKLEGVRAAIAAETILVRVEPLMEVAVA